MIPVLRVQNTSGKEWWKEMFGSRNEIPMMEAVCGKRGKWPWLLRVGGKIIKRGNVFDYIKVNPQDWPLFIHTK